jgi:hypothetical protein
LCSGERGLSMSDDMYKFEIAYGKLPIMRFLLPANIAFHACCMVSTRVRTASTPLVYEASKSCLAASYFAGKTGLMTTTILCTLHDSSMQGDSKS